MAASKLVLPGNFQAGKTYLLNGETLLAWRKALIADRVVPGPGMKEQGTPQGRVLTSTAQGGGEIVQGQPPAFYRTYIKDGYHWIQGGQVSGYSSVVADIQLAVAGSEPDDGSVCWLEVTGSGVVADGILYGGFTPTAVGATTAAAPQATVPTVESPTGRKFYLLLGTWMSGVFSSAAGGNLYVGFCGHSYSPSRF